MAYLKFNKAELVNLEYSLKREMISSNSSGAYVNTTIVFCNTRKYHGLLVVPIDNFDGEKHILLSSLDETLIQHGKGFNLGIHCYGEVHEPRGHKYIIDFEIDPIPTITYNVGGMVLQKSFILVKNENQLLIKYTLIDAHSDTILRLKPFLAFRNIHSLTQENNIADKHYDFVENGCRFKMYEGFPDLNLQISKKNDYVANPDWYKGLVYREEFRRGFDCTEDLFVPGFFEMPIKKGETIIFSASTNEIKSASLKQKFAKELLSVRKVENYEDCLHSSADQLFAKRGNKVEICNGFSWMATGVLRDTCIALPGLTLYNNSDLTLFKKVLDDSIAKHNYFILNGSHQVEAPLRLTETIQHMVSYTSDAEGVWVKYGKLLKDIIKSYIKGRPEVQLSENGLLWAELPGVALTWMNAYIEGKPLNERAGYQVETNCFWYNSICFALDMEKSFGDEKRFIDECEQIKVLIDNNFQDIFWVEKRHHLADYVGSGGQNMDTRPNQIYSCSLQYSPVSEEIQADIIRSISKELLTTKGLRTLSPKSPLYRGTYDGDQNQRDMSYHNGCVRPWLLGPYISANFKLHGAAFITTAEKLTNAFEEDMNIHGLGALAEIYDGDPPHYPHGAIISALSTAELLRAKYLITKYKQEEEI